MAADPSSTGPLAGVTVLDLSTVGPAARCTRLLADYGARVVKVGPVPSADASPIEPPYFAYSGHRGMCRVLLDLKDDEGREAFLALAAAADVVVESFRPGVVDRLGIGYEAVSARNPGIVYCSTSGYGQDGPHAQWAGHDIDYLAVGGLPGHEHPGSRRRAAAARRHRRRRRGGGMHAALAITAALAGRATTGSGAYLDVSVAEGVLWLMSLLIDEQLALGGDIRPGHDILSGRYACYGTYEHGRREVACRRARSRPSSSPTSAPPSAARSWPRSQLDDDAQPAIRAAFAAAFATRTRDEWVEELAGADTCVAPVLEISEVARPPAVRCPRCRGCGGRTRPRASCVQLAPLLAGMERPGAPVPLPDMAQTDTEHLLKEAGVDGETVARWVARKVVA